MDIWLINHYSVPPKYYPLARQANFAKYLMDMGHNVTIFAASTVHNSDQNLITDSSPWREEIVDGVHYVYIKCMDYQGNGLKRIYNMCEFAWKLPGVCKKFPKPDAIVATSVPPTSCAMGIHLARKYGCKGVAEIADLWPESIVVYGFAKPSNPAVLLLRMLEKWIYKKADDIVFTMEGAYDYIVEQGWEKQILQSKVHYINNGVDLELFDKNKELHQLDDPDLDDTEHFKVVYAGSIRKANGLDQLVDCAIKLKDQKDIRFLIYGKGDDLDALRKRCEEEGITNLVLKGAVPKACVPFILSRSNLNVINYNPDTAAVYKYGSSQNKLFEYMASARPILSNVEIGYSLIERYNCGICKNLPTGEQYADAVMQMYRLSKEEYDRMCDNARKVAEEYDFKVLTQKLLNVIQK